MEWNRSNTLGLAKATCCSCHGYGLRLVQQGDEAPCYCVLRAIFRACYNRFRYCASNIERTSTVSLEFCRGKDRRRAYGRKREEYMADFCIVSERTLDEAEYKLFRFHFLLGADWKLCCRQLGMDRGNFFHSVYRIEHKLGRAFAELSPYALFPLDEYFSGAIGDDVTVPLSPGPARRPPMQPPLRLPLTA